MKRFLLTFTAVLVLTLPASAVTPPTQVEIDKAKATLAGYLFDPQPIFGTVIAADYDGTTAYCGVVTARNRMGGYTGQTPFLVFGPTVLIADNDYRTRGFADKVALILKACGQDPAKVPVKF